MAGIFTSMPPSVWVNSSGIARAFWSNACVTEPVRISDTLAEKSVADLLPRERVPLPVVPPDATALEIAAIMAANRSPIVAVVDDREPRAALLGAISVSMLLGKLLPDMAPQREGF